MTIEIRGMKIELTEKEVQELKRQFEIISIPFVRDVNIKEAEVTVTTRTIGSEWHWL
jgi:hypothetical protein